jgi:hypothetical protein
VGTLPIVRNAPAFDLSPGVIERQEDVLVETFFIRHAAELEEKIEYIRQNQVKQGLEDSPGKYRWLFVKEITG